MTPIDRQDDPATAEETRASQARDVGDVAALRREIELLRARVGRLEREAAATRALVAEAKQLKLWDFTPYGVHPDESWVAIDRASASRLLAALASVDHWDPWHTRIEPRPQP
ncbi:MULTISPECIES: hypothetical protein [unclassified Nocardioides]|uniref:hypothetical protein n=1 Tax=unclassified Nocardioides TaxID=2615069 RepID=UPI00005706A6|nr:MULTISPECIES: hypothetical protein [unclassified Nocardioides]ABL80351.1 hypothetical protein Noca_0828 [Nocardioides sp. JS614]